MTKTKEKKMVRVIKSIDWPSFWIEHANESENKVEGIKKVRILSLEDSKKQFVM